MKLDDVRIGVRPGNGIVARVPEAILVIPFDEGVDQAAVDRLLAECQKGHIVRRLEELRTVAGAGAVSFAIVAEVGDTLGVFTSGDATVPLVGGQPVVRLTGRGAGGWTLLVPHGFGSLEVGAIDDAPTDPRLDLKAGVVPGRGVVLRPAEGTETAPAGMQAEPDDVDDQVEDEDDEEPEEDEDKEEEQDEDEEEDEDDEDLWPEDEDEDDDDEDESPEVVAPLAGLLAPAPEPVPEPEPIPAPTPVPAPAKVSRRKRGQAAAAAPEPEPVAVPAIATVVASAPTTATPPIPEVWGIRCKKGHFNDPAARYCAICGIHMVQDKAARVRGPRPVLGFLVLDDGTSYKLDSGYILGSDPLGHEDVVSGDARPLVVKGDGDVVSPVHARIDLQDWDVFVSDCGSVYGTYVWSPGNTDWQRLTPADEIKLGAGSQVMIAQRGFTFQPANKR